MNPRVAALRRKASRLTWPGLRWLHRHLPTPPPEPPPWFYSSSDEEFVRLAYLEYFNREPDPGGREHFLARLAAGSSRMDIAETLRTAPEIEAAAAGRAAIEAFHGGRIVWTRSLPPARRILDLGGTSLGDDRGALVVMGYPYDFDEVMIIELPPEQRHGLYQRPPNRAVRTEQGQVTYMYRSMTDLADLPDGSFDMICSAQTFEHIYPDEGAALLHDVRRLLAPGGVLALDTPNGAISSIQAHEAGDEFINPDHKVEYTHQQMLDLFADAGLRVDYQCGIGYMPKTAAGGKFILEELVEYPSLYQDIERCYTLAYLARAS